MCLIIYSETVKSILTLDLNNAWKTNSDGAGIVYRANGKAYAMKGIMNLNLLRHLLHKVPKKIDNIVVHLRLATHGARTKENTHPFDLGDNSYLMHNGILSGLGEHGHKGKSDSAHLAQLLKHLPISERPHLLNALTGRYAYVTPKKIYLIGGFETLKDGVEVSNTYWMPERRTMYTGNYAYSGARTMYHNPYEWADKD